MRRVDRVRLDRRLQMARIFGLAFTLGALTSGALIWRANDLAARSTDLFEGTSAQPADRTTDAGASKAVVSAAPAPTTGSDLTAMDPIRLLKMKRLDLPLDGVSRDELRDTLDDGRAAGLR